MDVKFEALFQVFHIMIIGQYLWAYTVHTENTKHFIKIEYQKVNQLLSNGPGADPKKQKTEKDQGNYETMCFTSQDISPTASKPNKMLMELHGHV